MIQTFISDNAPAFTNLTGLDMYSFVNWIVDTVHMSLGVSLALLQYFTPYILAILAIYVVINFASDAIRIFKRT